MVYAWVKNSSNRCILTTFVPDIVFPQGGCGWDGLYTCMQAHLDCECFEQILCRKLESPPPPNLFKLRAYKQGFMAFQGAVKFGSLVRAISNTVLGLLLSLSLIVPTDGKRAPAIYCIYVHCTFKNHKII